MKPRTPAASDPGGPRHLERVGRRPAAPGRARPDRPGEDQRRRARREGGGRHRRLERARPARARDRRGPAALRPRGRGAHAAREGRARDRPPRLLQRPDLRRVRVDARPARRGRPDTGRRQVRRRTAGSRTSPTRSSAGTRSTSLSRRPRQAWTRSSTTTSAAPTARSRRWSSPGLKGAPDDAIASFLAETRAALKPYGTYLGASVFGVAATRPDEVAQNIPKMAEHLDYVSAMVYPSHWAPGEYGVANPNARAVRDRPALARGLQEGRPRHRRPRRPVAPGLLARRPLRACPGRAPRSRRRTDDGIDEYLLWDPAVTYTARGAAPRMRAPPSSRSRRPPAALAKSLKPNELGLVPVLMHHQIRPHGSVYDMTAGAAPRRADAALAGRLLPDHRRRPRRGPDRRAEGAVAGRAHVRRRDEQPGRVPPGRQPRPETAVGMLEAFAKTHPDFPAAGDVLRPAERLRRQRPHPGVDALAGSSSTGSSSATTRRTTSPLNTLGPDRRSSASSCSATA